MRLWQRLLLRTQLAILLLSTIVVLQAVSIFVDYYVQRANQVVSAREGAVNVFRETLPALLQTPEDQRSIVARSMRTPLRVVLIEPQSGVRPDAGDVILPERSAAIAEFLRANDVRVAEFEVAERRVTISRRPLRGLDGRRPALVEAVGDRPPAVLGRQNQNRLPDWVTLFDDGRQAVRGSIDVTVYVLSLRPEGQTDWINLYSRVPNTRPLEPLILKAAKSVVLLVVLGGIALVFLGRLMQPLRRLTEAANQVGRGERIAPIAVSGSADLHNTVDAFNQMSERVGQAADYQVGLMRSLGHDLKGPLAAMGVLLRKVGPEETRQQIEARLSGAVAIVSTIMRFTRATMRDGEIVDIHFPSLLEALVEEQAELGHDITADLDADVIVRGRYNAMQRAFRNLIENGIKYGGTVRVILRTDRRHAFIQIDDTGPGIPDEKLETVFKPFERLAADTAGAGLGLSIVKSILVDHGATVELANRPGGGLRATAEIPL